MHNWKVKKLYMDKFRRNDLNYAITTFATPESELYHLELNLKSTPLLNARLDAVPVPMEMRALHPLPPTLKSLACAIRHGLYQPFALALALDLLRDLFMSHNHHHRHAPSEHRSNLEYFTLYIDYLFVDDEFGSVEENWMADVMEVYKDHASRWRELDSLLVENVSTLRSFAIGRAEWRLRSLFRQLSIGFPFGGVEVAWFDDEEGEEAGLGNGGLSSSDSARRWVNGHRLRKSEVEVVEVIEQYALPRLYEAGMLCVSFDLV
ncbi:hypothetical protein AX16_010241 [Volvariella volvacea WC 439]|nr:hypothetical protein AX16_010241 [Volvariella volvacea WC 439]